MTKGTAQERINAFREKLPYGASSKIAAEIGGDKHTAQSVYRGLASEKLTIDFYRAAKLLYPTQTRLPRKKKRTVKP